MTSIKKQHGFSLIELTFVVIVIAILAAAALPRFIDFTTESKSVSLTKSAQSIEAAIVIAEDLHGQQVNYENLEEIIQSDMQYKILGTAANIQTAAFYFDGYQPDDACRVLVDLNAVPDYGNNDNRTYAEVNAC